MNTKERGALRWRQWIALVDSSDIEHKYEADRQHKQKHDKSPQLVDKWSNHRLIQIPSYNYNT